ncbi:MAG: hypothetical protein JNL40_03000 [Cyclobacteriaceae bacterium]|nr:hypothetical protein [Cyclobacteriaceae bacterium]
MASSFDEVKMGCLVSGTTAFFAKGGPCQLRKSVQMPHPPAPSPQSGEGEIEELSLLAILSLTK